MIWAILIWVFLWIQVEEKDDNSEKWLSVPVIVAAVSSLIIFLIPITKMPIYWPKNNPIVSLDQNWSLAGSLLGEIWLLFFGGLIWVRKLFDKVKSREGYIRELVMAAIVVLVLFLDIFRMARMGWNYLDMNSSWTIATESLKNKALTGVGVGNFVEAFQWWRPASFNVTKNWSGVFNLGANGGLQLWTELGLVGLFLGIMLALNYWKNTKAVDRWLVLLLGAGLIFSPVNLVALVLVTWFLIRKSENREIRVVLKVGESGINGGPWIAGVVMIVVVAFGTYFWTRMLLGEIYLRNSYVAASNNDGGATYNWQIKAIGMNVNNADYRETYSQTNLALATSLLSNKDLSDDQKQKASILVQQSVSEAKAAVALDNLNPAYWSNLATIYQQLVGSVDGSSDWSSQAYSQAVALDPVNPTLRLSYGGLLYALGNYNQADILFGQVVSLKSDLANGWYNWAYTAKQLNDLPDAVTRLTQAISLVPVTSGDYDTASKVLDTWKKEYDASMKQQAAQIQQKQAETLKVPQALPSGTSSQVEVPNAGLEPPTGEVIPSVEPTAVPTAVVTP
jgi:tetratricopeptide (TPR) repeat protein